MGSLLSCFICGCWISLLVVVIFACPQDTNCSVCFENMDENNSRRLNPCGHRSAVTLHHSFISPHSKVLLHHTAQFHFTKLLCSDSLYTAQLTSPHCTILLHYAARLYFTSLNSSTPPHCIVLIQHTSHHYLTTLRYITSPHCIVLIQHTTHHYLTTLRYITSPH